MRGKKEGMELEEKGNKGKLLEFRVSDPSLFSVPSKVHPEPAGEERALIARKKSKRNAIRFVRELIVFVLWVTCFSATITLTRDNTLSYQFGFLFKNWLITNPGWGQELTTVGDFYSFLQEVLVKILADDVLPLGTYSPSLSAKSFLYGNKRIGPLRIRQVRVPYTTCRNQYLTRILGIDSAVSNIHCYPPFSLSTNLDSKFINDLGETPKFNPTTEPWFTFYTAKQLSEMAYFQAGFASYPGSGYVLDVDKTFSITNDLVMELIPIDSTQNVNTSLKTIQDSGWIDLMTRAIFVDFSFFNPNLNLFLVTRLVIEFLPSGTVTMYPTFRIVDPFRFSTGTTKDLLVIAAFSAVVLITLYYFLADMLDIAKGPFRFVKSFWQIFSFLNVLMMLALVGLTVWDEMAARALFSSQQGSIKQGDLQATGYMLDQEKNLAGIILIFMWIKLYKYFSMSRKLSTLTRTIAKAASNVIFILIVLIIPTIGFAMGCTLIFGSDDFYFSNFKTSLYTLLRAAYGDFNFQDWSSNRYLGPILLLFWVFFSNFLLLNIIIAILCDSFAVVMAENEELRARGVKSVLDIFLESGVFGKRITNIIEKQRQVEDIEAALEKMDADGDGKTDMQELESWLSSTGADVVLGMNAEDIMEKYDKDGSGLLDAEEMEQIKRWVASERKKIEEERRMDSDAMLDTDYLEEKRTKPSFDSSTAMALMQGGGGGLSTASEERILSIENNVKEIKEKVEEILNKLNNLPRLELNQSSSQQGKSDSDRVRSTVRGSSTLGKPKVENKFMAEKSIVSED